MSKITLEQWRVLQAVVDFGGFTQAADILHKSQSSVSYSVTKLQQQVGFSILVMEGRKAKLTERGRLLLEHSRALLNQSDRLELLAKTLETDWGSVFSLTIDSSVPYSLVLDGIVLFKEEAPGVRLVLTEGEPKQAPTDLQNELTSCLTLTSVPPLSDHKPVLSLTLFAVVAENHLLAKQTAPISFDDLQRAHEIKLRSSLGKVDVSNDSSTVANMPALIEMVGRGLGYAWLPMSEIKHLIEKGDLVLLDIIQSNKPEQISRQTQPLYVYHELKKGINIHADMFVKILNQITN